MSTVGLGDLPGRRAEREVAAELDAGRRCRVVGVGGGDTFAGSGFRVSQQLFDHRLVRRQHAQEAGEQAALFGVGAHDQRHPMRAAGPHGLDRVDGQHVVAENRADRESTEPVLHALVDQPVLGLDKLRRGRPQQRGGRVLPAGAEQAGEARRELGGRFPRPHHARGRAFRNGLGEQAFGRGYRQQRRGDVRARALPEDGDLGRVTAELGDVVADPLQRQHQVA